MRLVTKRTDLQPHEYFLEPGFLLFNMWKEGTWLVDKNFPEYEQIRETAINIAKTFGDKESIDRYNSKEYLIEKP